MLMMACMPVVIFYLIWLVNTSEGIRSEEGTLLDLVCWPDGNAIPVIIACGSIIAVVIETQLTIWDAGCEEKLISEMMTVSWRFNAVMALIIMAMIIQVIAVRYLHTAYRSGLHVGNQITCKAYLLRSLTDTEPLKDQSRKKVFKKRRIRQARTLHWVSVSYRRGKKRYLTSSASDVNSSDELLKPIYE
ncbi:hypothetical protein HF086_014126 [Spodoptera exigua]|uniref:G-protein coupled receptors family 2 profile 2 domain-containing protein n=1 Tax=Spodoptera exigua TaxID=7107 RepID=A0A922MNE4_SPOEX|nr:hypothetical protein HF086_014126 [Spodoptera exigua]